MCNNGQFFLRPQRVARAFTELRCTFGGRSIVPDVAVFVWEHIPRDETGEIANAFEIAPDWTIEILWHDVAELGHNCPSDRNMWGSNDVLINTRNAISPGQSQAKVADNIRHCLQHGSQMGWLIHPLTQAVVVFLPGQEPQIFEQPGQRLPVPEFAQALDLTVAAVFGWLTDL